MKLLTRYRDFARSAHAVDLPRPGSRGARRALARSLAGVRKRPDTSVWGSRRRSATASDRERKIAARSHARSSAPARDARRASKVTDVDRDPRAPPQALSGAARGLGCRRTGEGPPAEGGAEGERLGPGGRHPVDPGSRAVAAAPAGRAKPAARWRHRCRGRIRPTSLRPVPHEDPVVGHARRRPAPALGAALTRPSSLTEKVVAGPLGERQDRVRHVRQLPREHRRRRCRPPAQQRRGPEDVPEVRGPGARSSTPAAPPTRARSTATSNRPGGPHQGGSFNGELHAPAGREVRRSPHGRGDHRRQSATSASRSAVPTRSTRSTCRSSPTGARRLRPSSEAVSAGDKTLDEEGISTTPEA